jgi:fibronectin type 3 domain-containing protein
VLRTLTAGVNYVKLTTGTPITTTSYTDTTAYGGQTFYYIIEAYNSSGTGYASPYVAATPTIPAPTGLSDTVATNVVTLNWNAVAGVTGYEVLRGTASGGPFNTTVGTVSAPTLTLNDTTAIPGTAYYYVVEAYFFITNQNKPATFSPNSNQITVTVTATKLASPTGLQATLDTQGGPPAVNLGWNKEAGATSYNVLRSTTNGAGYSLIGTSPSALYMGDVVSPSTTYYYVVQAVNTAGTSGYSNQATVVVPAATIPATPIFYVGASGGILTVGQLDPVPGATSYTIYRSTSAAGTYTKVYTGGALTYTDTTAVVGTTYYYEMTASNTAGTSPVSAPQSGQIPPVPSGVKATPGDGQVVLTWNAIAGATSFWVWRGTTSTNFTILVGNPATNSITDTTAVNGTTYYYEIQTVGADGSSTSAYCAPVSATPVSSNVAAPTGLTATTVNAAGAVTLHWTASAGSTTAYSYNVYGGNTVGGEGATALATVTNNAITATVTGLASNKTWYFTVKAVNGASTSNASNEASSLPRVLYVPDWDGESVHVRVGGGATTTAITFSLTTCNPNSLAVNQNKLYVVCNSDNGNPDKILVYNAATIRAAPAGTLTISPTQTITSADFSHLIGIAFDSSNDLWVTSYENNDVLEFTAATLATGTPTDTVSLSNSPTSPAGIAFDTDGSLWVTGEFADGILLNFTPDQLGLGEAANPRYCAVTDPQGGICISSANLFEEPEGVAVFNGSVWVANNSTTGSNGLGGATPGRQLVKLTVTGGTLAVSGTYGKTLPDSGGTATSPFLCPGGLFATSASLWVNDESYGEATPQCGANGDSGSAVGGVFNFTPTQLTAASATQAPTFSNVTGRPGFGGVFVENDR